ncbi:unnamed protein product [Blepharisma stoltei]|uniref:EGF-like domain-containing protein n=1 Tax=Blepharisma stoltei TaxID=1481888 RepID=A0AAU9JF93_9CILI|nr:unnamed protein product [Blepharisma stoltei]
MIFDDTDEKNCKCAGDQQYASGQCTCPDNQEFNGLKCSSCGTFCKVCASDSLVCTECIDSSRMQFSASDNKICECKGSSQITTVTDCACAVGKYFTNNDCAPCGSLCAACADTTGICSSCKDATMTKSDDSLSCKCKPGLQLDDQAGTCKCPSGYYFDSNTCQPCGTHCSVCDSTRCSVCDSISHLIVDPSNSNNCICESSYYWIVANNDCEQCTDGTYYDGSKCSSCSTNCKACDNFTGKCNTCVGGDRMEFHPTDDKACRCKGTQILSGLTCSCSSGSYFDNLTCSPCSDLCDICTDLTGDCTQCKDLSLMTIDPQNIKNCKCKHFDLTAVSGQCVCTGGKQWNGSECSICGNFCKTCDLGNNVCTACIDSTRMDPVSSSVTCKCKAGLITSTAGCSCAAGSYYDSSSCSTCGDLCTDCTDVSGDCTACKDSSMEFDPTNKKICRCKGTQQYSTVLSTCTCPIGYYDGSTCQSCTTLCLTCDSTKCLTCQNIPHLVVDTQNPKNCVCASGYNWITASGSCEQCSVGTYYDGNKCASCSAMCATCSGLTGTCDTCKDTARMDLSGTTCICKGNQKLTGSTCFCDAGYYFDGSTCVKCSNLCSACTDYTGVCTTCKDSKMTFDINDNKNCKCIGDQILSGETCTCPSNQQFNGIGCSACGEFCSTCDVNAKICSTCVDGNKMSPVSGTVTCACKGNQLKTNTGCTCPSDYYFDSSTCSTCGDLCTTCTDISGACTACKSDKMEVNPTNQKVCRCKGTQQYSYTLSSCYCPTGYFDGSTCQSCTTLCSTCDSTKCLTCQGIANLIVDPQNPTNCVCASGYNWITELGKCDQCSVGTYYDGNKCANCAAMCATCSGLTGTCNTCKDTARMDLSGTTCICKGTQKLTGSACSCDTGYYFDGSNCIQCSSLCASCFDYTGECKSCKDSKMTFDPANKKNCICIGDQTLDNGACTCPLGQQFNGVKCSECGTFCDSCNVAGIICNICIDSTKMLAVTGTTTCSCKGDQIATVSGCSCPTGYYFKDTKCTQCGSLCALCADTTGICSTCKNDSTMEVNPSDTTTCRCKGTQQYNNALSACACPIGYFDNSNCKSCTTLCSTCDSTKCLTCQSIAHLVVDTQNPKNCVCASGYNWITSKSECEQCSADTYYDGNKCASCGTNCATCYDGTGVCKTCKSSRMEKGSDPTKCICKGTQKLTGSTCSCDAGYYFDGDTCVQCSDLCSTCEDYTGACETCKDSKLMTFDSNDNKKCKCIGDQILSGDTCTCPSSQQFNGYVCSTCGVFCSTCNVNGQVCSTCIDGNKMSPVSNSVTCACKGNQIPTNTGCTCPSGSYFDSTTCSTCGDFCTTCTDTSGVCTACKDSKMEVDPANQKACRCKGTQKYSYTLSSCYCPTGYFDGSTCQSCTALCSTCDSAKCLTCQSIANLVVDTQNPKNCVCALGYNWITASSSCNQCSVGTYYDGSKCADCSDNCASCYNGSGFCAVCKDSKMIISTSDPTKCICKGNQKISGSTCYCDSGYYFDGSNCVQCSSLCTSCSDYTGECLSCKDSTMTIDPANKKNCICIGDQILDGNNACTCTGTKQFNGAICSDCGTFCTTCNVNQNVCSVCLGNRMEPVSSTVTCACKGNQLVSASGCSCPAGSYFDSTTCLACGTFCTACDDLTGKCNTCNSATMEVSDSDSKSCKCKGTQVYSSVLSSCYCPTGYFDGSTCQNCTTLCSACDSTKCLTCQGIANLIVDPQNPTNCVCAAGYNWITATSSCEVCETGTYYDGNKCASCTTNCASCYYGTGFCALCKNVRMTINVNDLMSCICKGNQKISGSTCYCDSGYYFDGSNCVQCSSLCTSCSDYTGECLSCKGSKMTIDPANKKNCICIGDQILDGNNACTCSGTKQFNGKECVDCGYFCSTCDVSGNACNTCIDSVRMEQVSSTLTCQCKGNQIANIGSCTCPSSNYFDSSNCEACGDLCAACDDSTGKCNTCINTATMEPSGTYLKTCKCKGTQQYSSLTKSCSCTLGYFDGSTCQSCTTLCSSCDVTKCLACLSITNLEVDPNNPTTCHCAAGYNWITATSTCEQCQTGTYYDGDKCAPCSTNCAKCYNGSGICSVCVDTRMDISLNDLTSCTCRGNQKISGSTCSCDSGYYFDGSNCVKCSDLCATCLDYTGVCTACKDSAKMTFDTANKKNCKCIGDQVLSNNVCTCTGTKQFNGSECSDCGTFCSTCNVNAKVCDICIDTVKMTAVSGTVTCSCKSGQQVTATGCICASGSYFDTTTCSACGSLCATCAETTGKCLTCKNSVTMEFGTDPKTCKCKGTQQYNSDTASCYCASGYFDGSTCQSCSVLCSTCDSSKCLTCQNIANLEVDLTNPKTCHCGASYKWIVATSTCEQCATGTYYDGSQCASCSTNCASCFDGLGICGKCTDSRMTPNLLDLTKCICKGNQIVSGSTCTCDSGFYFNGENCVQCSSLCSSCLDYSGQCTLCKNPQTMIFNPINNKACKCIGDQYLSNDACTCDAGKQFNGEICSTCGNFCKTCNVAANSCSACINDSTMTAVASTVTCSCRPGLNTLTTGCTCNSNFYFDGSKCSACGDLCDTCTDISGKCNACKNMVTMEFTTDQTNCKCKGTQQYNSDTASCYCAPGYFDGSTCQSCSVLCSTCDSSKCLTCQNIANLEVDLTNPKTCHCAIGYKWIVEGNTSTCGKCLAGTYYDGIKCSSCSTNCATCYEGAGLCETCSDSLRMKKNPNELTKCICKGNQKVTGSTCSCDAGYYFDGDNCVQCSDLCKTCKDYTGECQECVDSTKMMVDTTNKKNCKCIGDQTLSNKQCTCSGNKQFNGSVCSDCGYFCSTCNTETKTCLTCVDSRRMAPVSGTTTCACKSNQITNTNSCSCASGSYFDDTTCPSCQNKCVSCKSLCATCDDYTGYCQTCKDTARMDTDPADKTKCICRGTQQLVIATSTCSCAAGTYYNGTTCLKCGDRCTTCEDYTGKCKTCLDPSRMDLSDKICQCKGNQQSSSDACSCLSMQYYDGSTCQSCGKNCKTCKDMTAECTSCYSNYALEQLALPLVCSCPAKTYDIISGCNPCGTMCASCLNAGICSTCNDDTVQELDQNNNQNCKCKAANYYDGITCQSCGTYCSACEATKCTQCVDTDNMVYNVISAHNCECKLGMYYDANSGKCFSCIDKCNVCSSGTSCTTCESGYYFDVPTSSCKVTTCTSGTYYDENSCKACSAPCLACSSSAFCYTCITADLSIDARAGTCNCAAGKWYKSSSKTCELCGQYCSTCTGTADFCSTCIDSTMTYNAVTGVCTCPAKTYFSGGVCKSCADPCSNCSSLTFCLSCVDATMTLTTATGVCRCKDGFYFDSTSHKCLACDATCATCSSSSSCSTCKDPTMTLSSGVCTCSARQYFDTQSLSCKNCDATCGKCTSSSSSSCTACRDPAMTLTNGVCTCPSTQYFNLVTNACKTCTGPCKSCTSDTFCTSCLDTATLNSQTGVCSCADKQYFNSTHSKCTTCNGLCNTCSSYSTCITCVDKTNPVSNGICTCANGYYALDKQCVMCPSPCSTCSSATSCTGCKKHATLNNSSKKCTCDRGYGLNSTDTSGYCVATCNKLCTVCDIDNANLCSSCVTNAELSGTTCACTANSAYSSATGGCACNAGYTLSNSKCVVCKRYLTPSDLLSAEFSSSWTSISINFNTKVDTSVDPSCSKTFTAATVALFGTGAVCSWTDKKTLKVALGTGFSLQSSTLYLDGTYILKDSSDPCTTNYQPLSLIPTSTSSPVPTAVITGQSSFTLGCGTDPLTFSGDKSTGSLGNNLSYLWAVTSISPANSKVSDAINNKADSSISIDRSYFDSTATTTVTASLTVTNFLIISNTASFTTTVTGGNALTVIFDQGNTVSMKSSTSKTLKVKVTSLCGTTTGTITWAWSYDSGPTIDSTSILANANADKLTINANALTANSNPYVFIATASQVSDGSTITGSATISVTVTASPLSVGLSKTSGDVSPDKDYTVNAQNSKDPDNPSSTYNDFTYKWTCLNSLDNSACVGADGKTPLSSDTDSTLTIPSSQMVKGAQWDITCTITKDTRTATATISLNILSKASDISIEIEYKVKKYNPSENIVITAQVTAASTATLKWTENSGSITISPSYLSTMSVLSGQLTPGSTYTFTLTIISNDISFKVHYPVTFNLGPVCSKDVSLNPDHGTAIITSFKLSIEGCYDKDEEDYPLSYTYLDYSNNKAYTLGYTTEINSLSTYLFPQKNTITIRVCDYMKTCNEYKKDVTIDNFNSRRLETKSLMDYYKESTVDVDNVPSTISLFCGSATIDSDLFSLMWTDLQNYISSNQVNNDVLENALGATYSMTGQTEQMSVEMFQTFAIWLSKIIVDNPDLVPSQDNMNTIVALADNYLVYGNITEFSSLSLEGYIMNIDAFLTYWEIAATKDDLVTQGAMDGSQNTDMTKIYKYRDFPTSMANRTVPFSNNRTISMPAKLSYSDTDVMNIKLHYFNALNDYSDLVMLSFAQSGTYENLKLETTNETYVPFSTTDYPVILEMPISQNITEGYDWTCLFYNETSKAWLHDGCTVTEIKNDSVVFEVYHFSMFKLGQAEPQAPPNSYPQPSGPSCGDNYAPLYILVVVLFISMILAPIMIIYDRFEKAGKTVEATPRPVHVPRPTERALMSPSTDSVETAPRSARHFFPGPQPTDSIELAEGEEIVEESEQRSSDYDSNEIVDSVSIDLTENSYAQPVAAETKVEKPEDESKTELAELIEGHLIVGLVYYRSNFSRWARLFTLTTIIIFELLLEGLLLFGFENTDSGSSASTETLFNDYEAKYFGYTILALAIAIPIEIFMVIALSIDRTKAPAWTAAAVALGITIIIGSIIGIVMLSFSFCFEWSGYWAVCFLYGILIQIFIFETFYMIVRYFILQMVPQVEETKTKA